MHSTSGTMALSEKPLIDAALMACAQINQAGGVLGQLIEPVVVDGKSNPAEFERQARRLLQVERVATAFGCWTSASRKAVKPIFEEFNALLWYPVQYEGLETSPNIFYTGSCPNQQVEPAVTWLVENKGKRFYLIGSDYVFPRTANKLIAAQLKQLGGQVVGEEYVKLGETNFNDIIARIRTERPDVAFNTLNGDSNQSFYRQYREAGISASEIPILAVSVAEAELQEIGDAAVGHYASWSYFQSIDTPENNRFVENFRTCYGALRVTSDPIEAAYSQVYLWKQAVEAAESFDTDRVRKAAYGQSFAAPGGLRKIEANHHIQKHCRIGKILPNKQFEIVHSSEKAIKPLPWMGVEELNFDKSELIVSLLAEVSQGIQQNWLSEQQSRELQQVEAALRESATKLRNHNLVLTQLAKSPALHQGDLKAALKEITEASAVNIGVERASVWLLDETKAKIKCLDLFEKSTNQHSEGAELAAADYPAYFQALQQDETIAAENASTDPRTVEFAPSYLIRLGIASMLDIPIRLRGQTAGVICLEHIGVPRHWTAEDQNFARSLADLVSLAFEATERKQTEAALRQSEERWQLIVRATGEGIYDWNIITSEAFTSPRLTEMLGYAEGEIDTGYNKWYESLHPEDLDLTVAKLKAHLEGKTPQYIAEYRQRCKDGSYKWILARGQAQRNENGKAVRMVGSHQDISDRKQTEAQNQLLLNLTQAINAAPDFDSALQVILQQICETTKWKYGEAWEPTPDGSALQSSYCWYSQSKQIDPLRNYNAVLTILPGEGIPGQVWLNQQSQWFADLTAFEHTFSQLELAKEASLKAGFGVPIIAAGDWGLETGNWSREAGKQRSRGAGEQLPITNYQLPITQSPVLAVLVFFTLEASAEDKQLSELVSAVIAQLGTVLQQKKVQAEMKALFAAMTDLVTVRDFSGRCLNVIPTNTTNLYKPPAAMIGRTLHDDLPRQQADLILKSIKKALVNQQTVAIEYCLPIRGNEVWLAETISPLSEQTAILVARDISQQQAALRERISAESALRQKNEELTNALQQLKTAQEELIQSEKMAALGQLVAGIAHEINTPLGAIRSSVRNIDEFLGKTLETLFLEPDVFVLIQNANQETNFSTKEKRQFKRRLRQQLEAEEIANADFIADTLTDLGIFDNLEQFLPLLRDPKGANILQTAYKLASVKASTQIINTAIERASRIVFALKTYARYDHSGAMVKTQLTEGIETVLTLYYSQLKHSVELIRNYSDIPAIFCYPDELNQVWTNLIHNAIQAMDNQGTLTIDVAQENQQVKIGITDSGKGIPSEVMPKIFEPFFTTKPPGEGSGMGLNIVKKIVEKHQGKITVESQPGNTKFTVYLPSVTVKPIN